MIDDFFESDFYKVNKHKIRHLFMANSNLNHIPNLTEMKVLETLDISNNDLIELPHLPNTVTELIFRENNITCVEIDMSNIIRFDGSFNKLRKLPTLNNARRIMLNNNEITTLECVYPKVEEFICNDNPLIQLPEMPNIHSIDCSNTKISFIFDLITLHHLTCNNIFINELKNLSQLETLEIINTKILNNIPYFPNLKTLLFSEKDDIILANQYKVKSARSNIKGIMKVAFLK